MRPVATYPRAVVLSGITTKRELLSSLGSALELAPHFGMNWDALQDCMVERDDGTTTLIVLKDDTLPDEDRQVLRDVIDDVCLILDNEAYELLIVTARSS